MISEPQRLAEGAAHLVAGEGLSEADPEAGGLALDVDCGAQVDATVLDARGVAAHGFAAEGALACRELELPVVPLAREHPVFAGPLRERIPLCGHRSSIANASPPERTQANRCPPTFRSTGRPLRHLIERSQIKPCLRRHPRSPPSRNVSRTTLRASHRQRVPMSVALADGCFIGPAPAGRSAAAWARGRLSLGSQP